MQGFAKLRQARIQERQQAIQKLHQWQQERSLEFHQEVQNTHAMLNAATQNRLAAEQSRLLDAQTSQNQRQQEVLARSQAVQTQLQHNESQRLATARADAALRLKELRELVLATQTSLAKFRSDRQIMSLADQQQRRQEFQARQAQIQAFLATTQGDRLAMAATQKQQLADYATYIHLSVWGMDYDNLIQESRTEATPEASDSPIPPISIETYITNYVNALAGSPTLTQVVNDRDTVKDLLTIGTTTLKVDPSEILNTLIKMVDLDN